MAKCILLYRRFFSIGMQLRCFKQCQNRCRLPLCLPIAGVISPVQAPPVSPRHRLIPARAPKNPASPSSKGTSKAVHQPHPSAAQTPPKAPKARKAQTLPLSEHPTASRLGPAPPPTGLSPLVAPTLALPFLQHAERIAASGPLHLLLLPSTLSLPVCTAGRRGAQG